MATQSYPRSTPIAAPPPALEMHWVAEGGRLRSRWSSETQGKQVRPAWLARACNWHSITERITGFQVHSSRLVHMLCFLLILMF
jgi:hypothetical protein